MTDPVPVDLEAVGEALQAVRARIARAGGDPERTTIVAVTKGFGSDAVRAAAAAGICDVGENYGQELVAKASALADHPGALRWHFLGPVQRNKVAALAPHVHLWQAVDRLAAGEAIAARRPGAAVLVQVGNGEAHRPGCPPAGVPALVERLRGLGLAVAGLMAVGPQGGPERARPLFRSVTRLADRLALAERSMGMTDDLEVAVQEGATTVRIGRALFGPRPGRRAVPG